MAIAEGRVLIDTSILIYSTLERDPRFARSQEIVLGSANYERFVSVQNLAEMYPNLTGPKMEQPDVPSVAGAKIRSIASLPHISVIPLTADILRVAFELCHTYGVSRQRYYDMQLVATMIVHHIGLMLTENKKDFENIAEILAHDPFHEEIPREM